MNSTSKGPTVKRPPLSMVTSSQALSRLASLSFEFDQPVHQAGGEDRRRQLQVVDQVGQRAHMVFVAVRDDDADDAIALVAQIAPVGQDQVDAQHVVAWEHKAGVDDQDLIVNLEKRHVLADLAEAAERDDS